MKQHSFDLCRSWLFVGAPDALPETAAESGADVMILELEDFTRPEARPAARAAAPELIDAWRAAGSLTAVRVNPLADDGREDLASVMEGAPDVVMLPKVDGPKHIEELADAIEAEERRCGLPIGSTHIVPNIESAAALFRTLEVAGASPRVIACLLASEDLTTDLGAARSREGTELAFARGWFHAACVAAGVLSIDYPYTFADEAGLWVNCMAAKDLGYHAKSLVKPSHAALANAAFTPTEGEVARCRRMIAEFEGAPAEDRARLELEGHLVELPTYRNAKALVARAEALKAVARPKQRS